MPNSTTASDGMSERELALWMLGKMQDSETFIGVLRSARKAGEPHFLDSADIRALHRQRLRQLHEGDDEEIVDIPVTLAAKMAALIERDLLSGPEELIEKAIEAYVERTGERDLPKERGATIAMARAEIEGRTSGVFHKGFVAGLARAARNEMAREAEQERDRGNDRDGRE